VGIGFYVAASVAGSRVEPAARTMVPFIVVLVAAVVLIAFVPGIAMVVPGLLGGK
jgi:C4-dicarboxylate transporter DctM subunit